VMRFHRNSSHLSIAMRTKIRHGYYYNSY
jgi:hypothetical protein